MMSTHYSINLLVQVRLAAILQFFAPHHNYGYVLSQENNSFTHNAHLHNQKEMK